MNIFCLDENPVIAAQSLCDKHVVKMGLESCQLLQNCFTLDRLSEQDCPKTQKGTPRKHFNPKHPCSIWARQTRGNMEWLIEHAKEIFEEKYSRYSGPRHFSHDFLNWVEANIDNSIVPDGPRMEFPLAINIQCNCRKINNFDKLSRVEQYRAYYKHDKPFATWKKNKPNWI